jgi:hypothetical protein
MSNKSSDTRHTFLDGYKANFETLSQAFDDGNVVLMECKDAKTGELVACICAVNREDKEVEFVPFARMFDGNPYEQLQPPDPDTANDFRSLEQVDRKETP